MSILIYLIAIICFIIIATARYRIHPFLTLLAASLIMGSISGLDTDTIINSLSTGFGNTLKSIGIVIACGTIIGTFLERTGGARSIADSLLMFTGKKRSHLAMNITGFIVSIPVFCDSGFVILSTLNRAINKRTGISLAVLGTALASGLYSTHVFVPPTPGPLAAASIIGADVGSVLALGLLVSIPVALVGWFWSVFYCSGFSINADNDDIITHNDIGPSPAIWKAILPIIIPIALISMRSIVEHPSVDINSEQLRSALVFFGHPMIALLAGVFGAILLTLDHTLDEQFKWVSDGLRSAGTIILITGAGGAFGSILRATDLSDSIGKLLMDREIGILLPFIIAAFLKTAQGSSTVSIITTAAMVVPLLEPLGLASDTGKVLVVLSIGAGAMTVSHLNDSYFWVVSQFSRMNTSTALRCHTVTTLFQGITGILLIKILSLVLL